MDYKAYFGPYANEQNKFIKSFFKQKVKEARKAAPSVAPKMWIELEKFMGGGKRMRGGLVKLGYESYGGKKFKAVVVPSVAVELMHSSILVHDDIIDQDILRHGNDTVHISYKKQHKKAYKKGDSQHYGESMGICVGLTGIFEATRLVADSDFNPERKSTAIEFMCKYLVNTGIGEALDVDLGYRKTFSERDVLTINRLKTAWYTIVGPLTLGAALTGTQINKLKVFEEFGLPLGIAYQLQDDILGMFGDEKKTGKSAASDIKEGKNTLLYLYALKKGNKKQQQRLQKLWGKKDITKEEIKEARQIVVDTGSLTYCRKRALTLADEAKAIIPQITRNKNLQEVYKTLTDYIVERES